MNTHTQALYALLPRLPSLERDGRNTSAIHDTLWPDQNAQAFREAYALFVWQTYPAKYNREAQENFIFLVAGMPQDLFRDFVEAWETAPFAHVVPPTPAAIAYRSRVKGLHKPPVPRAAQPDLTPPEPNPLICGVRARVPATSRAGSFHGILSL